MKKEIIDPTEFDTQVFVIYDVKSQTYSEPICTTIVQLERFIDVSVNTHMEMPHHLYPEDFVLYRYGDWANGKFVLYDEPEIMGTLAGYRKACKQCNSLPASDVREDFNHENLEK